MTTKYEDIIKRLNEINPIEYAKDRNYIDGSVTRLSPYISRGVISTKSVYEHLIKKGYRLGKIEKFVQELIWREYWQVVWQNNNINNDLKYKQEKVINFRMPHKIFNHETQIEVIDEEIKNLYKTGYMHNHIRMYVASLTTNIARYHWKTPAKWMYYHLFDADWGSNALSWQWVCGCNSNKKYYANQHNINKFTKTKQTNTFLDLSYEELINTDLSATFLEDININLKVSFPKSEEFYNPQGKSICIYNFYNLDPKWRSEIDAYRILLIEPSIFKKYPISSQSMNFMIELSKNIPNIKIIVSEFNELPIQKSKVYFKEHPLNYNYTGIEDPRDWICKPQQNFKSFFKHWKYVSKTLLSFSK